MALERVKCPCGVTQCAFSDMNDVKREKREGENREGRECPGVKQQQQV